MNRKLIIILFMQTKLFAYESNAIPINQLIDNSELIVAGEVISIVPNEDQRSSKAFILVKSVFKGELKPDTISVWFSTIDGCPSPAKYESGTNVLTFLMEDDSKFYPYGTSFSVRTLTDNKIAEYKKLFEGYFETLKYSDSIVRRTKQIDWLIVCLDNPVTKHEAIIIMAPDFFRTYEMKINLQIGDLNSDQVEIVKKVLKASNTCDLLDLALLKFIKNGDCIFLPDWCSQRISLALKVPKNQTDTYFIRRLILEVSYCFRDNQTLHELGERFFKEDLRNYHNLKKMIEISDEFMLELNKVCS